MFVVGVFGEDASPPLSAQKNVRTARVRVAGEGMVEAVAADGGAELVSPSSLIGLLGIGADGGREAKRFVSKWGSNIGGPPPPLLEIEPGGAATAASDWIAERLLQRLAALVSDNQALGGNCTPSAWITRRCNARPIAWRAILAAWARRLFRAFIPARTQAFHIF